MGVRTTTTLWVFAACAALGAACSPADEAAPTPIAGIRRPQDPQAPFPYDVTSVRFSSAEAGVTLAGTLTSPRTEEAVNAVVLVSGSGAQNRNSEVYNHRPFLVLADALSRANIAVLRYDDRGTAHSTGTFATATYEDFADDVQGALQFLREQQHVRVRQLGIVGHSEGGLIAPMVTERVSDVAFLVLLAAPALNVQQVSFSQLPAVAAEQRLSDEELSEWEAQQTIIFSCARTESTAALLERCLTERLPSEDFSVRRIQEIVAFYDSPLMRFALDYDPAATLRHVQVPVLALNGSLDVQVLPELHLPVIAAALADAGNAAVTIEELPGLNHLFQHAVTGLLSEYESIDETMAPEVLNRVSEWIAAQ